MNSTKYKRPESVLVVIHKADGMILLLKRADVRDFWQSVTGSMGWGEKALDTATREVFEETGLTASDKLVDWRHSATFEILQLFKPRYAPDTHHNLEHMFSLQAEPDCAVAINPYEHTAFEWKHYSVAVDIVWSWSNREAIELLAERYWT